MVSPRSAKSEIVVRDQLVARPRPTSRMQHHRIRHPHDVHVDRAARALRCRNLCICGCQRQYRADVNRRIRLLERFRRERGFKMVGRERTGTPARDEPGVAVERGDRAGDLVVDRVVEAVEQEGDSEDEAHGEDRGHEPTTSHL